MTTFRVATYNANSLRARLHIVLPWLQQTAADVLCLQETKVADEAFPAKAFEEIGYQVVFRGEKAYNGVAVATRHRIEAVAYGFDDPENRSEDEGRLIRCVVKGLPVVNTYVPQGRAVDHDQFRIKLRWFERLEELFDRHYSPDAPFLWCGDLNVAPGPEDVYAPELLKGHVCFHPAVREAFASVKSWGLVDVFRKYNSGSGHYTFYDYRVPNAVKRRMGWRIDHILATAPLAERAVGSWIDIATRLKKKPSDHSFLVSDFEGP